MLALLGAFVPLSTDLYLPALPTMSTFFHASTRLTNLTLILFFVFFATGTLFWGPLSDRLGRRPVLLTGMSIYVVASVLCALAPNIYSLILFRVLQGAGGSAAFGVSTAIIKDVYSGRRRETALAMVQSMVVIAPAVAPILGAFLFQLTSWRGIFWTLSLVGIVALTGALLFQETLREPYQGALWRTWGQLYTVLRNRRFAMLLADCSIPGISALAFVAGSSYIYIRHFGLSERAYSFYFAANALGLVLGPVLYMHLSRRFRREKILSLCFGVPIVVGTAICLVSPQRPIWFALLILPATIAGSCARPPATYLMLAQQKHSAGAAASLISCFGILMGSAGMSIISLGWTNLVLALAVMNICTGILCSLLWVHVSRLIGTCHAERATA